VWTSSGSSCFEVWPDLFESLAGRNLWFSGGLPLAREIFCCEMRAGSRNSGAINSRNYGVF
jgi:hypothetical protein